MADLDNQSFASKDLDFSKIQDSFNQTLKNMIDFQTGFSKSVSSFERSVSTAVESLNKSVSNMGAGSKKFIDSARTGTVGKLGLKSEMNRLIKEDVREQEAFNARVANMQSAHIKKMKGLSLTERVGQSKEFKKKLKDEVNQEKIRRDKVLKQKEKQYDDNSKHYEQLGISRDEFLSKEKKALDKSKNNWLDYYNALKLGSVASYFEKLGTTSFEMGSKMAKASASTYKEVSKNRAKYLADTSRFSYTEAGEFQYAVMADFDMGSLKKSAQLAQETMTAQLINGLEQSDLSNLISNVISQDFDPKSLERLNVEMYAIVESGYNVSQSLLANSVNSMADATKAFSHSNIELYDEMNSSILRSTAALADTIDSRFAKDVMGSIQNLMEASYSDKRWMEYVSAEKQTFFSYGGSSSAQMKNMARSGDVAGIAEVYAKAMSNIDPNSAYGRSQGADVFTELGLEDSISTWLSGQLKGNELYDTIKKATSDAYSTTLGSATGKQPAQLFERAGNWLSNITGPVTDWIQSSFGVSIEDISQFAVFVKMLKELAQIRKNTGGELGSESKIWNWLKESKLGTGVSNLWKKGITLSDKSMDILRANDGKLSTGPLGKLNALSMTPLGQLLGYGVGIIGIGAALVGAVDSFTKAANATTEQERKAHETGGAFKVGGAVAGLGVGIAASAGLIALSGPVGWAIGGVVALAGLAIGAIVENNMKEQENYALDSKSSYEAMINNSESAAQAMGQIYSNAMQQQFTSTGNAWRKTADNTMQVYKELVDTTDMSLTQSANMAISAVNNLGKFNLSASASLSQNQAAEIAKVIKEYAPGHRDGLASVPYDDYLARLHKDEMVLTSEQAGDYRNLASSGLLDTLLSRVDISGFFNSLLTGVFPNGKDPASYIGPALSGSGGALSSYLSSALDNKLISLTREVIYDAENRSRDVGSIVANDNGGLSIGLGQWHNSRAFSFLKSLRDMDSAKFNNILAAYPSSTIGNDLDSKSGKGYVPGSTNKSAIKAILECFGREPQDMLMAADIRKYMRGALDKGFNDGIALIIASTIEHNIGNLNAFPNGNYNSSNILSNVSRFFNSKYKRAKTAYDAVMFGAYKSQYDQILAEISTGGQSIPDYIMAPPLGTPQVFDVESNLSLGNRIAEAAKYLQVKQAVNYNNGGSADSVYDVLRGARSGRAEADCSKFTAGVYKFANNGESLVNGATKTQIGQGNWVYKSSGLWLNRVMDRASALNLAQPGDLLFWDKTMKSGRHSAAESPTGHVSHVEIYVGNGQMIGSQQGVGPELSSVKEWNLNDESKRYAFLGVKRYAQGTPWVPNDQVAIIHKEEAIIPAEFNPYNNGVRVPLLDNASDNSNSDVVEAINWMVQELKTKMEESDRRADTRTKSAGRRSSVDHASTLLGLGV